MIDRAGECAELIEWATVRRPLPGQSACGDQFLVRALPGGVLIAVLDGLGHGVEAEHAARMGLAALRAHAGAPVLELIRLCHEALRRTRGVAMSLAVFDAATRGLEWAGVGNVEGVLCRGGAGTPPAMETILLRGGVVGYQLPPLKSRTLEVAAGDLFVLASDGIGGGYTRLITPAADPRRLADDIHARYAKAGDDALVLVARFREV